jgi:hypothetical protein
MECGGTDDGVSCNYNSYNNFDINQSKIVTRYSLLMPTRGEDEFWACWCTGNATGHFTGSRACRLLP